MAYDGYKDKNKRRKYQRDWMRQWRAKNPELARKRKGEWIGKNKEHIATYQREWRKNNTSYKIRNKEYNQRNPKKVKAGNLVRDPRISTFIPLNPNCEFCGNKEKLQRHHPDYDEPLIIVTCCKECHEWVDHKRVD